VRWVGAAAVSFGLVAVVALLAALVVDSAVPEWSEGWGLLLVLVAFLSGGLAVCCGVVFAIGARHIHRRRMGLTALTVVGAALCAWLVQAVFFH
jgi:hypothetical protein